MHRHVLLLDSGLLQISYMQKRYPETLAGVVRFLRVTAGTLDATDGIILHVRFLQADVVIESEQPAESRRILEEVLRLQEQTKGPRNRDTIDCMLRLASSCTELGDVKISLRLLERALKCAEVILDASDAMRTDLMRYRALSLALLGRRNEAIQQQRECIGVLDQNASCEPT